ncbi:MAG: nucleotidyl transferase AbiEii/AbiGii toxin family protein [Vampirovibrionales bacterium]|nr:nucleotidyl transferase AbiEii/AbiGii toxin family protein [Vampirovibrionales bacterium]
MTTFEPCYHILPAAQKDLLPDLKAVSHDGFVLYGGTAIALRLGHRESVDFDFFSNAPFEAEKLFQTYAFLKGATVLQQERNTLTALVKRLSGEVKLSFFGGLPFGRVATTVWTADHFLKVASLDDLLALKLAVLLKRVEVKDYKDIVALLRHGLSLSYGLNCARLFYPEFQPNEALKALVYFEGGDLKFLPEDDQKYLIEAVTRVDALPEAAFLSDTLI